MKPSSTIKSTSSILKRLRMTMKSLESEGSNAQLLINHFRVELTKNDGYFYHYNISSFHTQNIFVFHMNVNKNTYSQFIIS